MRTLILGLVTCLMVLGFPAKAAKAPVYTSALSDLAIGGYDAVSYQTGTPVEGVADYALEHQGATWRFASQANLVRFSENPDAFAPQFGGYCAYAVANGSTAKGDPLQYSLVDGRLYLNFNAAVKTRWLGDVPGNIRKGEANWPRVLN